MGHGKGKAASSSLLPPLPPFLHEDFNSYNDGPLTGQHPWVGAGALVIQGAIVYEGAKAVRTQTAEQGLISRPGYERAEGRITVRMRKDTDLGGIGNSHRFTIDDTTGKEILYVEMNKDKLQARSNGAFVNLLTPYVLGQWYKIVAQWRGAPGFEIRYRVDSGAWTGWIPRATAASVNSAKTFILFSSFAVSNGVGYFDYIR